LNVEKLTVTIIFSKMQSEIQLYVRLFLLLFLTIPSPLLKSVIHK